MVMRSNLVEVTVNSFACVFITNALSGKTVREGMGQATNRFSSETLDLVITNALIVDWSGIYKVNFRV